MNWQSTPRRTAARLLAALLPLALLPACSSLPGVLATSTLYVCQGGKQFDVRYVESDGVALVRVDGQELRLTRKRAGSGAVYSDGRNTLATKGQDALLETGGVMTHYNCRPR